MSAPRGELLIEDGCPAPSAPSKCLGLWGKFVAPVIIVVLMAALVTVGTLLYRGKTSTPIKFAVEKGIIGFPIRLPDDGKYIQWTFLQLNDVYEMLPLDNDRRGGLARVAHLRKLLVEENNNTFTLLAGDLISPSALSQALVNETNLNGRQMIAAMNTLGLDFITFGNHEFDFNASEIQSRMSESKFTWISTNVLEKDSDKSYSTSIPYKLLTIDSVHILIFGLTIYVNRSYVQIVDQPELIPYVQSFLRSINTVHYDVLVALTHLSLSTDINLLENIPQIDLLIGGHEHQNYYQSRGARYTPISKADGNAFSVYIHRCAFNLNTTKFRVYSTLALVTPDVPDDAATAEVVNTWYNLAIEGFEKKGFQPNQTISCLPEFIELDGRFSSVRVFPTLLSNFTCECMRFATAEDRTVVGAFDAGSIRIDDILRGTITEYDALRVLPYENPVYSLAVPGQILADVLTTGMKNKGQGHFVSYCGDVRTIDGGQTWLIDGEDISKSGRTYNVATMSYAREHIGFDKPGVAILQEYNITQTQSFIKYLPTQYPPC